MVSIIPFLPSPIFHFFPSISPLSFCVFLASKNWERKRERAIAKKITEEEAQERERASFGVKGEVPVSSFLLLSDWPLLWSLNLGPTQRWWAVCHFAGGAGRGGAGAGGGRAGSGTDAAGRGKGGGLRGFGYGSADQSSARVLAHVEQSRVVEEKRRREASSLTPRGPQHHFTSSLKTGKRQLATTGC